MTNILNYSPMQQFELYKNDITRSVNPAVSAGDFEPETIKTEIDEYVFTPEIIDGLYSILYAIKNQNLHHAGIWVSGYFGSGKSHFLKYLGYCLHSQYYEQAFDRLINAVKENDPMSSTDYHSEVSISDLENIKRWIGSGANVDIILFNIGTVHNIRGNSSTTFLEAFWNEFNKLRGYNGFNISLAQHLEKVLDEKGKFDEFKARFADMGGNWETQAQEIATTEIDLIMDIAKELVPTLSTDIIRERIAKDNTTISVETFCNEIKQHTEKKGSNYRLIFLVDEVSQFIESNKGLLLQLQEVVTNLYNYCKGQAWVTCTAQQDLSELLDNFHISKTTEDYGKIMGRFEVTVSLKGTQPEFITQKRILSKTPTAELALIEHYNKYKNAIETQFDNLPRGYRKFTDAADFADYYPFVPYQFKLLMDVFNNFVELSFVNKEVKGNERSIIKITHKTAQKSRHEEVGNFISFDQFYEHMFRNSLTAIGLKAIQHANAVAKEYSKDVELATRVVNVLFMVCNLSEKDSVAFPATLENITCLLMKDVRAQKLALKNDIQKVLEYLIESNIIHEEKTSQSLTVYKFYTEDEREIAQRIKNSNITLDFRSEEICKIVHKHFQPGQKETYCGSPFAVKLDIDGYYYCSKTNEDIVVKMLMDGTDVSDVNTLAYRSNPKELIFCVYEKYESNRKLLNDFHWYCQVQYYLRNNQPNSEQQNAAFQKFREKAAELMMKEIQPALYAILDSCEVISNSVRLTAAQLGVAKGSERYKKALEAHFSNLYPYAKLGSNSEVPRTMDELKRRIARPFEENYEMLAMSEGEKKIEEYLSRQVDNYPLANVVRKFYEAPYGWSNVATIYFLNELVRRRKRDWCYNNNDNIPAALVASNIGDTNKFTIKQAKKISQQLINSFVESWKEIFNSRSLVASADSMQIFETCKTELRNLVRNGNDLLQEIGQFPFAKAIKEAVKLAERWENERDQQKFFNLVVTEKEEGKRVMDAQKDVRQFVTDQIRKYVAIVKFVNDNRENLSHLTGDEELVRSLKAIIEDESPMSKMPTYNRLQKEAQHKIDEIRRKYLDKIHKAYEDVIKKLEEVAKENNVATSIVPALDRATAIYDTAMSLDRLSAGMNVDAFYKDIVGRILEEVERMRRTAEQKSTEAGGQSVHAGRSTRRVTLRTSSARIIKNANDVEAYLDNLRKQLMDELKDNDLMIL